MQKGDVLILITNMAEKLEKLTLANKPFQYVVAAYFFAVLPTLILSAFLYFVGLLPQNKIMSENSSPWADFAGTTLFAPLVETLLMLPIFAALRKFTSRVGWLCIWSALIWALLHSALHPVWGLTTFWTFLVLSFSFLLWERRGKMWAFAITAIIHSLNNTIVVIALILSR
jgi:membrane protease YdiL (CAAX protease family)